ncbi:MAG: ThiF family adenylyltransferase [Chloroflexi bacterium]|nr:ThiF family adenylyltransferase [Chloroflexota bacterium]
MRGPDAGQRDALRDLALRINPSIDGTARPTHSIVVGQDAPDPIGRPIYVGAEGGAARISGRSAQPCGTARHRLGAGSAACLGMARLFREVFARQRGVEGDVIFDPLRVVGGRAGGLFTPVDAGEVALLGAGAVGQACIWALKDGAVRAALSVVDPQSVELSNLQRYVLAERADVGRAKGELVRDLGSDTLTFVPAPSRWQDFLAERPRWDRLLIALDRIGDRRELAATLPRWIGNAWTQLDDLGVSTHLFADDAPCLQCLYLPQGEIPDEDDLVAAALGIEPMQFRDMVRQLLYSGEPVTEALLSAVAAGLKLDRALLEPYQGRGIRALYSEGVCGGALVPIDRQRRADADMHVPLAHQSALAGVLLAAALCADATGQPRDGRELVRVNLMKPLADQVTRRRFGRDSSGRCICHDPDYERLYAERWPAARPAHEAKPSAPDAAGKS